MVSIFTCRELVICSYGGGGLTEDLEFDFSGLKSLADNRQSNKIMFFVLLISGIILTYTSVDLYNLNNEVRELIESENQWQITFDLETISYQDSVILNDGEQRQFDYEISDEQILEGYSRKYHSSHILFRIFRHTCRPCRFCFYIDSSDIHECSMER